MTPWGKPSNLWISWVYSFRPRVPSWLWIRWIQSASHRKNSKSPSTLAMSTAMQNSDQTFSYFIPGQHFLGTFTLLSPNDQDHTFNVHILNQQTRLLQHLRWPYLAHTFNNPLTVTLHISLKHLAAKIPYQLHNYFLPFYETCSISINPLFQAVIKNYHKNFSTSWNFSPLFSNNV